MAEYWGQQASGLLIYTNEGQILLLRRGPHVMGGNGKYSVPGGRVDIGDTPQASSEKEGKEEMGGVPKGKFTGSFVFKRPLNIGDTIYLSGESEDDPGARVKTVKKTGENFEYHTFYYLTDEDNWKPKRLNWENDAYKWFDAEEAANDSSVYQPVRDMIKNGFLKHFKKSEGQKSESLTFKDVARSVGSCLQML